MTMTDENTDTSDYVAENSDATQPPDSLAEDDAEPEEGEAEWVCAKCGTELADAMDLADHECEG